MYVIGVDIGTSSVRLAIVRFSGPNDSIVDVIASHKKDIRIWENGSRFEQSSFEIWAAICECSKKCLGKAKLNLDDIKAVSFSATCSLVILDAKDKEGKTSQTNQDKQDIIMWMDHRAIEEANKISELDEDVCQQFGGTCSPEFSLSKILWLRRNDPKRFESSSGFFELNDWLVYRCIGGDPEKSPRSLGSLTSKWGYNPEHNRHCNTIQKLLSESKASQKVGETILAPGTRSGYLSQQAALELGFIVGIEKENNQYYPYNSEIIVATSLIDAHAGMLGMLSVNNESLDNGCGDKLSLDTTLCSLTGTSCCHLFLSQEPKTHKGVWGPYKDAILKDYYLLEAGQSLVGRLLEKTIENHKEGRIRLQRGDKIYEIIADLNKQIMDRNYKTKLHVLPFHHGNRSPLSNPRLMGGIYGLTSDCETNLIDIYAATVEALVYENRLIIEAIGAKPTIILVSGGLMKNSFYMQTLATVLNCRVIQLAVAEIDFMVFGSCLLAKHAVRRPDEPITKDNMGKYHFDLLKLALNKPQIHLIEHYEARYNSFKCFVEFSLKMDQISG